MVFKTELIDLMDIIIRHAKKVIKNAGKRFIVKGRDTEKDQTETEEDQTLERISIYNRAYMSLMLVLINQILMRMQLAAFHIYLVSMAILNAGKIFPRIKKEKDQCQNKEESRSEKEIGVKTQMEILNLQF